MINNLNEAVHYFLNKKSNENLELEAVNSIGDNYGNPKYCIIKRKDNNYYFLFYRERFRTGFDKEFNLSGSGDKWINLNLNAIRLAAFEYNNAAVVVILGNGDIQYTRSMDVYNFAAQHNTIIS